MTEEFLYETEHTGTAQKMRTEKKNELVFFRFFFFLEKKEKI